MKYEHVITLVLGDWSSDGHGRTDQINISSNLNKAAINKAYKAGSKKLGFDFVNEVCEDFEDNRLPHDKWKILQEHGFKEENLAAEFDEFDEDDGEISLWTDGFTEIYLFVVKLGNEKFEYEFLTEKENPEIHIGGYGLFSL